MYGPPTTTRGEWGEAKPQRGVGHRADQSEDHPSLSKRWIQERGLASSKAPDVRKRRDRQYGQVLEVVPKGSVPKARYLR